MHGHLVLIDSYPTPLALLSVKHLILIVIQPLGDTSPTRGNYCAELLPGYLIDLFCTRLMAEHAR